MPWDHLTCHSGKWEPHTVTRGYDIRGQSMQLWQCMLYPHDHWLIQVLSNETANDEVKQVWYADDSSAIASLAGVKNGGNTYRPRSQTISKEQCCICVEFFEPLENAVREQLIPDLVRWEVSDVEWQILALPLRHGGLGLTDPRETAKNKGKVWKYAEKQW